MRNFEIWSVSCLKFETMATERIQRLYSSNTVSWILSNITHQIFQKLTAIFNGENVWLQQLHYNFHLLNLTFRPKIVKMINGTAVLNVVLLNPNASTTFFH
jgi:hypothetical protein